MIELRRFALLAAAVLPGALLGSACSSDASLGRDRAEDAATAGAAHAGSAGSAGSGNAASGSGGGMSASGGSAGGPLGSSGAGNPSGEGGSGGAEPELGGGGEGGDGGDAPNLDDLNTDCPADDACSEGLTPVHFYGIAGEAGPEFCWCTIPCEDDPNVCPQTTTCTATGDGPGTVCFAN